MTTEGSDDGVWELEGDQDCAHPDREHLGADDHGNAYYRCVDCEGVVVETGSAPSTDHRHDDGEDADMGPTRGIGSRLHLEGLDGLAGPYGGSGPSPRASDEPSFRERLGELGGFVRRLGGRIRRR